MSTKPIYIRALEALRRREGLFRVFIFSLVTVMFWIGFSIFFAQQKTKVKVDTLKFTQPLNPNINREILQDAAQRKRYTEAELQNFPIYDRLVGEKGSSQLVIAGTAADESINTASTSALPQLEPITFEPISSPSATPLPENVTSEATAETQ